MNNYLGIIIHMYILSNTAFYWDYIFLGFSGIGLYFTKNKVSRIEVLKIL